MAGIIAICFTGISLGTIPLFKGILVQNNFVASEIALMRVSVAFMAVALLVGAISVVKGCSTFMIKKKDLGAFIGYGAISIAAVNYFYLKSLTCTSTAIAVVTVFVAAPLTTLIAGFFTGAKTSKQGVLCTLVIVFGCVLVNMQLATSDNRWDGIMYAALAGVCYGLYGIFGKSLAKDYDYPVMMFWQFLIASITTLIAMVLLGGNVLGTIASIGAVSSKEMLAIAGIGVFSTFVPYLLYSYGLKKGVAPSTASALTLLEPISGTMIAFAYLGEAITLLQGYGMVIVIIGSVLLINKGTAKPTAVTVTKQIRQPADGVPA